MYASTIFTTILAATAILVQAAPAPEAIALERRVENLEKRLVCQVGGLFPGGGNAACSAECVAKGKSHGGHCNDDE